MTTSATLSLGYVAIYVLLAGVASFIEKPAGRGFGAFRFPLGLAASPLLAAGLLAVTGFASALTDIPLTALVQQRIPDRHLAKALGLWEAGIAAAIAIAPVIAAACAAASASCLSPAGAGSRRRQPDDISATTAAATQTGRHARDHRPGPHRPRGPGCPWLRL